MKHLTFSGSHAGKPFCNCNKEEEIKQGNVFIHYSSLYRVTDQEILDDPDTCENCKKVLKESLE